MTFARLKDAFEAQLSETRVGSGKFWKNTLTKPQNPRLTGLNDKENEPVIFDPDRQFVTDHSLGGSTIMAP